MTEHTTVLLQEAVEALVGDVDGFYVDGTFGRGGHCAELLSKLSPKASVLAVDKDLQAISVGEDKFSEDARIKFVHGSFADLSDFIEKQGRIGKVAGVLLDLWVHWTCVWIPLEVCPQRNGLRRLRSKILLKSLSSMVKRNLLVAWLAL